MNSSAKRMICALLTSALFFCAAPFVHGENSADTEDGLPELVEGETISDGSLIYTKSRVKGTVYITSCESNITNINIKSEIDGYRIMGICSGAFAGQSRMQSVEMDDGIEYIGTGAFYQCENLSKVRVSSDVKKIPDNCFFGCTALKEADIPETVTSIGAYSFAFSALEDFNITESMNSVSTFAFSGCSSLKGFTVSEKNTGYRSEDGVLYSKDGLALEIYPAGKEEESFSIPETVEYIQPGAFQSTDLKQIKMTDSVKWIGMTAFADCKRLEGVTLSNSITQISVGAFSDCIALENINIPDSVTSIGEGAFYGCNALKRITVSDKVDNIGEYALGITDGADGKQCKIKGFKIKANYNSAAGKYAREKGVSVKYLDGNPHMPFIIIGIAAGVVIIAAVIIAVKKKLSSSVYDDESDDTETVSGDSINGAAEDDSEDDGDYEADKDEKTPGDDDGEKYTETE